MSIRYGYELDDGTVEWFQGGKLKLTKWSSNDIKLSISAKDRFDSLDSTYQKGIYREEGASLYDLANDVFLDAGVDLRDFEVDPYLKNISIQNPIPAVKHKEALQLIANAGRCILYQDRYGKIILRSDFMPEMSATAEDKTRFTSMQNLLHSDAKSHYANLSQDYTRADGKAYFLPKDSDYLNTGYISESVSNEDGSFADMPKIAVQIEHGFTVYGLRMLFHEYAPEKMSLAFFYQGNLLDTMDVNNADLDFKILQQLPYMDKLVVSFIKQSPNTRVVLDSIIFGDLTDYCFTYGDELKEYPVGTIREKTQRISVVTRKYNISGEMEKELIHEKINQTEQEKEYEFYMNSPSYGYRASAAGHNVEIVKSSCYMVRVKVQGTGFVDLSITGHEYLISNGSVAIEVNPSGRTLKWENPLISADNHAIKVGEWMKPFLASNREYSLVDRGEVRLDGADLAYLDSKHEKNMLIKITDYTMNFNGAFSGSAKARRV